MTYENKAVPIKCPFCGSKLGRIESREDNRVWFHCSKCREDLGTILREDCLTFEFSSEMLRQVPERNN